MDDETKAFVIPDYIHEMAEKEFLEERKTGKLVTAREQNRRFWEILDKYMQLHEGMSLDEWIEAHGSGSW